MTVPVLELDSGRRIADIVGICRYFEETHPTPPLMGTDAEDKAVAATPGLKDRALLGPGHYPQIPALVERSRARVARFFERLDARLADNAFVAGPRYTIADITALVSADFAGWAKLEPPAELTRLKRWHDAVSARPSAKA